MTDKTKSVRYVGPSDEVTLVALDVPLHMQSGKAVDVPADVADSLAASPSFVVAKSTEKKG